LGGFFFCVLSATYVAFRVNKKGKVSNGNYVRISYFYSYLNEQGRAGFVMSSQASSGGQHQVQIEGSVIRKIRITAVGNNQTHFEMGST